MLERKTARRGRGRRAALPAAAVAAALTLAACGGASGQSTGGNSQGGGNAALDIVSFVPFSGADAAFGDLALSGCYPAVYAINKAGGVLVRKSVLSWAGGSARSRVSEAGWGVEAGQAAGSRVTL